MSGLSSNLHLRRWPSIIIILYLVLLRQYTTAALFTQYAFVSRQVRRNAIKMFCFKPEQVVLLVLLSIANVELFTWPLGAILASDEYP